MLRPVLSMRMPEIEICQSGFPKKCVFSSQGYHTEEGGGDGRYGVDEAGDGVGRRWSHLKLLDEVHLQGDI